MRTGPWVFGMAGRVAAATWRQLVTRPRRSRPLVAPEPQPALLLLLLNIQRRIGEAHQALDLGRQCRFHRRRLLLAALQGDGEHRERAVSMRACD